MRGAPHPLEDRIKWDHCRARYDPHLSESPRPLSGDDRISHLVPRFSPPFEDEGNRVESTLI